MRFWTAVATPILALQGHSAGRRASLHRELSTRRDLTLGTNCSLAAPDLRAEVLATDNCGGQIAVTQTPLPGAMLSLGTNLITLVALDTQSNAASWRLELVVNANSSFGRHRWAEHYN